MDGAGNRNADPADAVARMTPGQLTDQFGKYIADRFIIVLIFQHRRLPDASGQVATDSADHKIFAEVDADGKVARVIQLQQDRAFAAGGFAFADFPDKPRFDEFRHDRGNRRPGHV